MTQPNPLGYMPRAGSPDHGILEGLLQRPMDLVADFLDRGLISDDQCFAEVGLFSFPTWLLEWKRSVYRGFVPFRVYPHELQLLPASLNHVLDAKIELTAHDYCVWFSC